MLVQIEQLHWRANPDRMRPQTHSAAMAVFQHHASSLGDGALVLYSLCSMIACSAFNPSVRAAGPGCRMIGDLIS